MNCWFARPWNRGRCQLGAAQELEPDLSAYGGSRTMLDAVVDRSRGSSLAGNPVVLSTAQQRALVARVVLGR